MRLTTVNTKVGRALYLEHEVSLPATQVLEIVF